MKNKGVTLIELLVVLAILSVVLTAVYDAYLTVLNSYKQETTTSIANIDKLIGLEILRRDIQNAGFGIPANTSPLEYDETNNTLIVRSTISSRNDYTKCYGYIDPNGVRLFTLDSSEISVSDCNDTSICYLALDLDYNQIDNCYSLGSPIPSPDNISLLFAVNSTDYDTIYELASYGSNRPTRCYEETKALKRKDPSTGNPEPILDCVKEFKVAFGRDSDNSNNNPIDTWSTSLPSNSSGVRQQVKQIIIFIVYHEGAKDPKFNYSGGTINFNTPGGSIGQFNPTGDELHYRWKLIKLSVKPMNLQRESR